MRAHGIDMWIVAVKENHTDPLWEDLGRGYVSGLGYYVFTNRGGRIKHWFLKDYRDGRGESLDLVPSAVPADQPIPFSLRVDDGEISNRLNSSTYKVTGDTGGHVDATRAPATAVVAVSRPATSTSSPGPAVS